MANFQYIAKSIDGKEVSGIMQAENETAVVRTLDEHRLFPVRIAEQELPRSSFGNRIRLRDLAVFYGQLADLLGAGVPILRSLDILTKVGANKKLCQIVERVREQVSAGEALAEAMAEHPAVFTTLHTAMIRAGERAGFLEEVLTNLSGFIERQDELRSKVRGAMVYPVVLMIIGTILVTGILVFLVPRFQPLLVRANLPLPTRVLFAVSNLLVNYLYMLVLGAVLAVILIRSYLHSEYGKEVWDRWRMKLPVLGHVVRMVSITRFSRILGTMLKNGVPILQALDISKDATGSPRMAASIADAAECVRNGDPLANPLRDSGYFPAEVVEMIAIGEESNQIEKVLLHVADTVERRTNRHVDNAVRLVEPLILILLAAVIGFVAVGLLYPIFTMGEQIK